VSERFDAIVAGGGHNGLVAAAYLARAGLRTLVLERRPIAGGAAVSEEVWPGWTVSSASYVCSLLHPGIVADLDLTARGYHAYAKDPSSFTPLLDGRSLLLSRDPAHNAAEVARFEPADVEGLEAFEAEAARLGSEFFERFEEAQPRPLAPADERTINTSAAELVERFVTTPVLQATLATDGLIGTGAGVRENGTAAVLAYHYAGRALGRQGAWGFVRGGMGSISQAIASAAVEAGAAIETSAEVSAIAPAPGGGFTVVLSDGREFATRAVVSNADPFTTFRRLLRDLPIPAAIERKLANWRCEGVSLKLNLALGEAPNFTARPGTALQPHHRATIHLAPSLDYLQRAFDDARRLGASPEPMLECFMQTPTDPSLAPPGKHLLSIFAQYFPYARADGPWTPAKRDAAAAAIVGTLAKYAPNLPAAIEAQQLLAPPDLEEQFNLPHGHIFHGELLPGQLFADRFPVRTGIEGIYLCGSSVHPGGCVSGIPGLHAARAVLGNRQRAAVI
jgi:phytoene dehydrogenase-like protein